MYKMTVSKCLTDGINIIEILSEAIRNVYSGLTVSIGIHSLVPSLLTNMQSNIASLLEQGHYISISFPSHIISYLSD